MVLYFTINNVDSSHGFICSHWTLDTKDILYMDDYVLILTNKSLATGSQKLHILDMFCMKSSKIIM